MTKYLVAVLVFCSAPCMADVRLPKILGPNMVMQRESRVKVWGWADAGEEITVSGDWAYGSVTTKADADGKWQCHIRTGEAGGPNTLTIAGKNKIELRNILFGEVWLASGQSNMEMPLVKVSGAYTGVKDAAKEVAAANYPEIRLFQVGNFSSKEPLDDVQAGITMYGIPPAKCKWEACTPQTIRHFSSTAYFFARHLYRELKVPIGIIDASWGGTSAEAWTPAEALRELRYTAELKQAAELPQKADQKIPTRLYNGMIHPLRNLKIQGVIWYQGESNVARASKYRSLFLHMISHWRAAFGEQFAFYFVQIAPFHYRGTNAAFLREAQLEAMSEFHGRVTNEVFGSFQLADVGMVVTMDIGNPNDIHPKNKQEVGRRLALWALANNYGRRIEYSGPIFDRMTRAEGALRIQFQHATSGLATRDGKPPSHFEIAGADKVFHPATAVIEDSELVVSSKKVPTPVAVRYAFTSDAQPNLMNKDGLPASPFRAVLGEAYGGH